jgi:hypothetical protein
VRAKCDLAVVKTRSFQTLGHFRSLGSDKNKTQVVKT